MRKRQTSCANFGGPHRDGKTARMGSSLLPLRSPYEHKGDGEIVAVAGRRRERRYTYCIDVGIWRVDAHVPEVPFLGSQL